MIEFYLTLPKLEILKCYEYDSIHLADPTTIKHIELVNYTIDANVLKNIEYLKFESGCTYENLLSVHPKLRTLVWNTYYDTEINALYHLVEQKRILKRPELKIYFQSVELIDRKKIEEYEMAASKLAFQINNFNLLCDNFSFEIYDALDYTLLMELANGTLPDNFFKKFFNIRKIKVSGKVKNQEHLVWFLKSFEYLSNLELDDTFLDQNFYDSLHEIGQLRELCVENCSTSIINYDFLLKLKFLEVFRTNHDCPGLLDLASELYKGLRYFRGTYFYVDKEFIIIHKYKNYNYFCRCTERGETIFSKYERCFDQLLFLINEYKNMRYNLSLK